MYSPKHVKVLKAFHEFHIDVEDRPAYARDLTDAIFVVEQWIEQHRPELKGYDDRFTVSVRDEGIVITIPGDTRTEETP